MLILRSIFLSSYVVFYFLLLRPYFTREYSILISFFEICVTVHH